VLSALSVVLLCSCANPRRTALATHVQERFTSRADGLIERDTWRDKESGGGIFLFADPNVQGMAALHTNQTALGGGSSFIAGSLTLVVDTNTAAIIGAGGTALGNIIGASVKSAIK
jgi:hypothetical protein